MSTPFSTEYPELAAIAATVSTADTAPYFTGAGTAALFTITSAGRALVDDADAAAQRATLGLTIGTNVQAYDAELAALAGVTSAADKVPYFTGSGTASVTDLSSVARTLIGQTTQALMRTTGLGCGTAATANTGTSGTVLGFLDGANVYTGSHDFSLCFRARGSTALASGFGVEIGTSGTSGNIQSYDRTAAAYKELRHIGLSNTFYASATLILTVAATVITAAKPVQFPSYTVATVPAASLGAGSTIYVSDESGGAVLAFSDATNWRRVTDRAVIS